MNCFNIKLLNLEGQMARVQQTLDRMAMAPARMPDPDCIFTEVCYNIFLKLEIKCDNSFILFC